MAFVLPDSSSLIGVRPGQRSFVLFQTAFRGTGREAERTGQTRALGLRRDYGAGILTTAIFSEELEIGIHG